MKEDNNMDQEVKEMLDTLTEHGRNERRQQQLSAMMDRSDALKRRRHWLWAIAAAVTLSAVVALSLNSGTNKPTAPMMTMNEPVVTETPQKVEEPASEAQDEANPQTFDETGMPKPTSRTGKVAVKGVAAVKEVEEPIEVVAEETIENHNVESVQEKHDANEKKTRNMTDSIPPIQRENPYRPKNKFTLRVGGEIDPYSLGDLPFPPVSTHFALGLTLDYHFTENLSVGLGAEGFGVSTYGSFYANLSPTLYAIPVFADIKLNFWGKKNYSPFVEARLGYSIPLNKVTIEYPENGSSVSVDYVISGPYVGLGLGCSMKRSNLSAGVVYSHARSPESFKDSFHFLDNLLAWGTNFFIRYDYTFSSFSDEGKRHLGPIKRGKREHEFDTDGLRLQLNVAGGFRPWCYSAGAALEYRFPKHFSAGVGADFRSMKWDLEGDGIYEGYSYENVSGKQLLSLPIYGGIKARFWENKPFSPFLEYRVGYAFALNKITATQYNPWTQQNDDYEARHHGLYAYLGIGVTYGPSSLSFGMVGQEGKSKWQVPIYTYFGQHDFANMPFELRYSYRIGK